MSGPPQMKNRTSAAQARARQRTGRPPRAHSTPGGPCAGARGTRGRWTGGALEPLHARADQGSARVVVERDPRAVVEQALLRALVELHARGTGRHRVGLVEQAVELRAAVPRGVPGRAHVARVEQHGEEVLGVGVVGDPALAEHGDGARVHHLEVGRPVETPQLERDAHLPELGLQQLGDPLVEVAGIEVEGDRRQPAASREARLGEELAGLRAVEAGRGHARVVARKRGRQDPLARDDAALEQALHHPARVDGVRHRQPDPAIVEGRLLHVEAHRVRPEGRPDRHLALQHRIGLHRAAMPGRDVGEVEVAGLVVVEAGDLGGDDAEHHPLEPRRSAEVLGEGLQHHPVVPAPFLEAERAAADRVRGEGGAQALGLLPRHDRGRVVGHEEDERRERPVEPDLDGAVVRHADPGDLAGASLDEGGGARDLLEDPRAACRAPPARRRTSRRPPA